MIDSNRVVAIIPARGGSKGVPRKNIKLLGGKPLIEWTIEAAQGAKCVGSVIISTDDNEIASVASSAGCNLPFMRPADLASDTATSIDVISHALESLQESYDWFILLQPTSPFRTADHIEEAFELVCQYQVASCVSVVKSNKSPEWMFWIGDEGRVMKPVLGGAPSSRRQDCQSAYLMNGAIYVCNVKAFLRDKKLLFPDTVPYVMSEDDSLDIDTIEDFGRAEIRLGKCSN